MRPARKIAATARADDRSLSVPRLQLRVTVAVATSRCNRRLDRQLHWPNVVEPADPSRYTWELIDLFSARCGVRPGWLPTRCAVSVRLIPGCHLVPATLKVSAMPYRCPAPDKSGSAVVAVLLALVTSVASAASPVEAPRPAAHQPRHTLTSGALDALILASLKGVDDLELTGDEVFLRRASFDLIGRQPTAAELERFLAQTGPDRRQREIDRLLLDPAWGTTQAIYWSDTIAYRVPPPELTFLDYRPLRKWLSQELNNGTPWDQIVSEMLTGTGQVAEHPEATFVAYHQGNPTKLAAETARVFLGLQIQCAECHDHPFDHWKREQFHQLAAFFARSKVKMPWNEGPKTAVSDAGKGEYRMPDATDPRRKGQAMPPAFPEGAPLGIGRSDLERRRDLAVLLTDRDNPWFARSTVNRVWAQLMGRGFFDPVDDMSEAQVQRLPAVHDALTEEFVQSGFDMRHVFRLVAGTRAYQQSLTTSGEQERPTFASAATGRLQGDAVYDALATALALPDVRPPTAKPTRAVRFPVPPKSTRETFAAAFGYDPSLSPDRRMRNMGQAMLMMNGTQLQQQIDASPDSGTMLSQLLESEPDNRKAVQQLFRVVLARTPTLAEVELSLEHLQSLESRGAGFEDLLWSLVNSAEFTTRR